MSAFVGSVGESLPERWQALDTALLHSVIAGHDPMDSTSLDVPVPDVVGAALDAEQFQRCFVAWVAALTGTPEGVIAIDGKTARRSGWKRKGQAPIHMVSAFAARQRLVLGQVNVAEKSNEIVAIPALGAISDVLATLGAARSNVVGPVTLTPDYLDPARVRVLHDLAVQAGGDLGAVLHHVAVRQHLVGHVSRSVGAGRGRCWRPRIACIPRAGGATGRGPR